MDNGDGGNAGLHSHLETTTSITERRGLETRDLTVQSQTEWRIKAAKVLYIYNEMVLKRFPECCALEGAEQFLTSGLTAETKKNQLAVPEMK